MHSFGLGQRWISNAEPELGIGQIVHCDQRQVTLHFPLSDTERTYAVREAPLIRVRFSVGDVVESADGWALEVESVTESEGLYIYVGRVDGEPRELLETRLKEEILFSRPEERLFTHQADEVAWFDLRYRTLVQRANLAESPARGLLGPRVELIPHQLYIGAEVANRFAPRVLLADEVGLGKTIEAGLVIHQQVITGRASRVLVIVPRALTFQWFVEMIRRFNLQFTLLDEERCLQIEQDNLEGDEIDPLASEEEPVAPPEALRPAGSFNPFEAQQFVLCSLDLFTNHEHRMVQALAADWDLLVVDEAHHLRWDPHEASPEYSAVERLARTIDSVLLLTATPEQLGKAGHFARLQLLDPNRFHSFERFQAEEENYAPLAQRANDLLAGPDERAAESAGELAATLGLAGRDGIEPSDLIRQLLDRHGTGRVLFRNVRSSVSGFADRSFHAHALPLPEPYGVLDAPGSPLALLYPETLLTGDQSARWPQFDPRVSWLADHALSLREEKMLVICADSETAQRVEEALRIRHGLRTALFHEGMDLVARDRAAAYFAEQDRGAQILISSEIGSEGRNFQFAHHLALFDLPANPDLLEQRIGRLDRIGQRGAVTIHLPYFAGSPQEVLYRWYHEALNLFLETNPAAPAIHRQMGAELARHMTAMAQQRETGDELERFIARSAALNVEQRALLAAGRDRLLEINSHHPERAAELIAAIRSGEGGEPLQEFMECACELYGLDVEPLSEEAFVITPTERMVRHTAQSLETQQRYRFPELPDDGVRITYDRAIALAREDLLFVTWEHPMVRQAIDLITSDVLGNSAAMVISDARFARGTLLVETIHLVEAVAPPSLQVEQFLPPGVIRSLIDPSGTDLEASCPYRSLLAEQVAIDPARLFAIIDSQGEGLRRMLVVARECAHRRLASLRARAQQKMERLLGEEQRRLTALAEVNPNVRVEELRFLRERGEQLTAAIARADLRLDAVRVIVAA